LRIVAVDKQAAHGYLPLVQERLCGRIDPEVSQLPTAKYLESLPRCRFVHAEVVGFDPQSRTVTLGSGERLRARFVVVALGSALVPPVGIEGLEHLLAHKDEAQFARSLHALSACLSATAENASTSPEIAVVGGGISGCELAGELASLRRRKSKGSYPPAVTLVSADARLVPGLGPGVGRRVEQALVEQGVAVRLQSRLIDARAGGITVQEGAQPVELDCDLAFWTGGIRPAPILGALGLPRTEQGWLAVGPTLQCFPTPEPSKPEIFACGDAVRIMGGEGEWPTMQRAIECLWQAKVVARNIIRLARAAPDFSEGVPPLHPHRLRESFFYGVSVGARSLVVWGNTAIDLPGINHWFRRWLMRQYFARYEPL
jgi:NADH dehydrogenase